MNVKISLFALLVSCASADYVEAQTVSYSRFIAFPIASGVGNEAYGLSASIQVRLDSVYRPLNAPVSNSMNPFVKYEGQVRWVGPPQEFSDGSGGSIFVSELQCTPYFRIWNNLGPFGNTIYIQGAEIVPSSSYTLTLLPQDGTASPPAVIKNTSSWCDVVSPFASSSSPPQPDLADVAAVVEKYRNPQSSILNELQASVASGPAGIVDVFQEASFDDVAACLAAVKGAGYSAASSCECPPPACVHCTEENSEETCGVAGDCDADGFCRGLKDECGRCIAAP